MRSCLGLRQPIGFLALEAEEGNPGDIGLDLGLSLNPVGSLFIGGVSEYALFEYALFAEFGKESDLS